MYLPLFANDVRKQRFSYEISEKTDKVMHDVHAGTICVRPLAAEKIELLV